MPDHITAKPSIRKNRINKAETVHVSDDINRLGNLDEGKKVKSINPYWGHSNTKNYKSVQQTKSVSHAPSPTIMNDSNTAQVTDFRNQNNDFLGKMLEDEALNL